MIRSFGLLLAILVALPAQAGEKQGSPQLAKKIAPWLDESTISVFHLDLTKLDVPILMKAVAKAAQLKEGETAAGEGALKLGLSVLKGAGVKEVYGVVSLADLPEPLFLAVPTDQGADAVKINAALKAGGPLVVEAEQREGMVLIAKKKTLQRLKDVKATPHPQLEKAFAALGNADARAAVFIPEILKKAIGELNPRLPKELGNKDLAPLLKGFQWGAAGLRFGPTLAAEGVFQATDAKSAEEQKKFLIDLLAQARKEVPDPKFLEMVDKAIKLLTPKIEEDRLTWKLSEEDVIPIAQPIFTELRKAATAAQSQNNLRQIGLALHNAHDTYKQFPAAAIYDKAKKKPLLSWRVHILPYVEGEQLYKQFKLDEPWDSPHNKELISQMPAVFRNATSTAKPGLTTYVGPYGKGLFWAPGPKGLKISNISDGTSNTIMVLEVDDANAVIWTKPEDLPIDIKNPLKGLGGNPRQTFSALFADGSVRIFSKKKLEGDTFYKLLTIGGGEVIPNID